MEENRVKFDLVVVGGGPAGSVAALTGRRAGMKVALVDRTPSLRPKVGESLPGAARPLLARLGLLGIAEHGGHLPCYGNLSAWGSDKVVAQDFIRDPNGVGWHLDRDTFDASLKKAASSAGVETLEGIVHQIQEEETYWCLTLSNGEALRAKWIIDATGRRSAIATKLGATYQADFPIMAAVTWVKACDNDSRTFIESTQDGWWYSALLPDGNRIVSFHALPDSVVRMVNNEGHWEKQVASTKHLKNILSGTERVSEIHGLQACGGRLDRFWGHRWLAVGDAALSLDPLSSQGIFNGLYTGWRGAQAVISGNVSEYAMRLEAVRDAYLQNRRYIYNTENRWNDSPFWSAQHDKDSSPTSGASALSVHNRIVH